MSDPCRFVGVEGDQCTRLNQLLQSNPCIHGKGKRAPSAYNMYIKACLKAKGGVKKFGEAGPKMRECATEYKEDKGKGKTRYVVEVPPTVGGQEGAVLWKGRDMLKEWNDLYGKVSGHKR